MEPAQMITQFGKLDPVPLKLQLEGRLRNMGKPRHWYMAIAEAIKNSLDAIEDSGHKGWVRVELERGSDLASEGGATRPVQSVLVRDNGIGFTDDNFVSFCTPDSLYKMKRGGKGLGRLICLQAFRQIQVKSVYRNGSGPEIREFVFQCEHPEIAQSVGKAKSAHCETVVRLTDLRDEYAPTAAIEFEDLVDWLAEHFLPALVERPTWLEKLLICDGDKVRDLTQTIQGGAIWATSFTVNRYDFHSACYALRSSNKSDQVRFVADGRVVDANTRDLEYYLPHLGSVADETKHVVLVRSPFFDEHVNDARNGVTFNDEGEEAALLGITAAQFREGLARALRERLGERLNLSDIQLRRRIDELVQTEAPGYRPLLRGYFESRQFADLGRNAHGEEILASLDAYRRDEALRLKRENRRLAKLEVSGSDYAESARKLAQQVDNQMKVALAEYVTLRKIILDRLEKLMETADRGRGHREEAIHNLVFPQKTDTETSGVVEHHLWILDERLESHNYLASDKPLDGKHGDRPDLLIALDRPGAFASDSSPQAKGYERIALVEFKRALRDLTKVPTDELPHRQMMRYALQITEGKAKHIGTGRPITVSADARFYLYAVCELPASMLQRLRRDERFTPSPTGDGAFSVENDGRYYIEYISLPKLLEDAKLRNQAFFQRLGLEA